MRNIYDACLTYENNLKAKVAQNIRRVPINSKFKLCGKKSKIHERPKLHVLTADRNRNRNRRSCTRRVCVSSECACCHIHANYTTGAGKRQISFKFTSKLAAKFTGKLAVTSILLAIEHAILHQALLGTYKFKNQKSLNK